MKNKILFALLVLAPTTLHFMENKDNKTNEPTLKRVNGCADLQAALKKEMELGDKEFEENQKIHKEYLLDIEKLQSKLTNLATEIAEKDET